MAIHSGEGIVLSAMPYSNTSLIVSLLTAEEGKVRLVAKGARSAKSRFGGSLEPATHVYAEWSKRPSAEMGTLRMSEIQTVFRRLWSDLDAMALAGRLLKTMDRLFGAGEGDPVHYGLLLETLQAVESGAKAGEAEGVFLLMLLERLGLAPRLAYCAECKEKPGSAPAALDVPAGELRCPRCPHAARGGVRLRAGAVATMEEVFRLPSGKMRSIKILPSLQEEVIRAARAFLAHHAGLAPIAPARRARTARS